MAGLFDDVLGQPQNKSGLFDDLMKPKDDSSDFIRGAKVAAGQFAPLAEGAIGLVGKTGEAIFGEGGISTAIKDWGIKGYTEGMQKLQPLAKDTDELTTAWDKAKEGHLGALVDWAAYGLGYGASQLVAAGATAVAGGLIGTAIAGPAGGAAGLAEGAVAPGAIRALAQTAISGMVEKEAAKIAVANAAKVAAGETLTGIAAADVTRLATANVARSIGQTTALVGYSVVQEAGSIYPEAEKVAKEQGRQLDGGDLARVWATTAGAALLEGVTDKLGLAALSGKIRVPGKMGVAGRVATGGLAIAASEAGTEAAQTVLERYGAGQEVFGDEGIKDIINSAGMGAIGGAPIGALGGALRRNAAPGAAPTNPDAGLDTANTALIQVRDQYVAQGTSDEVAARVIGAPTLNDAIGAANQAADGASALLSSVASARDQQQASAKSDEIVATFEAKRAAAISALQTEHDTEVAAGTATAPGTPEQFQADREAKQRAATDRVIGEMGETLPRFRFTPELQGNQAIGETTAPADLVAAYVTQMRQTSTPAAQAFVHLVDTGRVTATDVHDLIAKQNPELRAPSAMLPSNVAEAPSGLVVAPGAKARGDRDITGRLLTDTQVGALDAAQQRVAARAPVLDEAGLPITQAAPTAVGEVRQRLDRASTEGLNAAYLRQKDIQARGQVIGAQLADQLAPGDQASFRNAVAAVASRGGVASPMEAAALDRLSPTERLYDSIEGRPPALKVAVLPTVLPTAQEQGVAAARDQLVAQRLGLAESSPVSTGPVVVPDGVSTGQKRSSGEILAKVDSELRVEAGDRAMAALAAKPKGEQAQAGETTAPDAARVIEALRVAPALRTAEDKLVVDSARSRLSGPDLSLLQAAATAPFSLSATDHTRLGELKKSEPREATAPAQAAPVVHAAPVATNLATLPNHSQAKAGEMSKQSHKFLKTLASFFGKKVNVYESTDPAFADGYINTAQSGVINLNRTSQKGHMVVFGHELMHVLKVDNPAAYAAVRAIVRIKATEQGRFESTKGIQGDTEELISDLQGDLFADATFWASVLREVAGQQGEAAAKGVAATILRVVSKFIRALKSATFDTRVMVENMEEVRSAITVALATYATSQKGAARDLYRNEQETNTSPADVQESNINVAVTPGSAQVNVVSLPESERELLRSGKEPLIGRDIAGRSERVGPPTKAEMASRRARVAMGEQDVAPRVGESLEDFHARQESGEKTLAEPRVKYSEARAGRLDNVEAYHYSQAPRQVISTQQYGTGLRGSGRDAYLNADDQRRRHRAYLYFDKGTGINPESGVGGVAHRAMVSNVYDINKDPMGLRAGTQAKTETNVLDAGFNGYIDRLNGSQSGQVVMLGAQAIPVKALPPGTKVVSGSNQALAEEAKPAAWETQSSGPSRDVLETKMAGMAARDAWSGYDLQVVEAGKGFYSLQARLKEGEIKYATQRTPEEKAAIAQAKVAKAAQKLQDAGNARLGNAAAGDLTFATATVSSKPGRGFKVGDQTVNIIKYPAGKTPRIEAATTRLHGRVRDILRGKSAVDFVEAAGNLLEKSIKMGDIRGLWAGEREDSLTLRMSGVNGQPLGFSAQRRVANLIGMGFIQEGVVTTAPSTEAIDGLDPAPAVIIGKPDGSQMDKREINDALAEADKAGFYGASESMTGKGIKFIFFPEDSSPKSVVDQRADFIAMVQKTQAATGLTGVAYYTNVGTLDSAKDHWRNASGHELSDIRAATGSGGNQEGAERPLDLFRGLVDNLLAPYIAAARIEGFGVDLATWGRVYGATRDQIGYLTQKVAELENINKHGVVAKLRQRVSIVGQADVGTEALIALKTTNGNAEEQLVALDSVLNKAGDPTASVNAWLRMYAIAYGTNDVPMAPARFISMINSDGIYDQLKAISAGQVSDADHGFANAADFRRMYESGEVPVAVSAKLMLWSFLSRGVSPYVQESAFIDLVGKVEPFTQKMLDGSFSDDDIAAWNKIVAEAIVKGTGQPGAGTTHNANAFGGSFMRGMADRMPDGRTKMQYMHDLFSDPAQSGKAIRREFVKISEGVGIDNKVISFTLLVIGHHDVAVLDRVQIANLFNDGRLGDYNLYDGITRYGNRIGGTGEDRFKIVYTGPGEAGKAMAEEVETDTGRKVATALLPGSGMANLTTGARGLMIYEALEAALERKLPGIFSRLKAEGLRSESMAPSVGRWHWESWVAYSGQEASHKTLDALLNEVRGRDHPFADVPAKEGEYGAYNYGAEYSLDRSGAPYKTYTDSTGQVFKFTLPEYTDFIKGIKQRKNGVVPPGFKVSVAEGSTKENKIARTEPWHMDNRVNRDALDALIAKHGVPMANPTSQPVRSVAELLAQGQRFSEQRDTAPFKEWFADSQVVDGRGQALMVYRGTKTPEMFDGSLEGKTYATRMPLFTTSPSVAGGYAFGRPRDRTGADAPTITPVYLAISNALDTSAIPENVLTEILSVDRNIGEGDRNRLDLTRWRDSLSKDVRAGRSSFVWTGIPDAIVAKLEALGYDGIKDTGGKLGGEQHTVWMPFKSEQIKSAIGNNGNFDRTNPDIRRSAQRGVYDLLRKFGRMATSTEDAERALSNGDRVFFGHDMGEEEPTEVRNTGDMRGYTADQIIILPAGSGQTRRSEQRDTAPFKEWFADSHVVDGQGRALMMYTGTSKDADFTKFKIPKNGAWFSTDRGAASQYALENDSKGYKYDPDVRTYIETNTASRVMPVFLRITNPATLSAADEQAMRKASNYRKVQGQIFDRLRALGHDGVNLGDGVWVVIGEPAQIKSAIGNNGNFDRTNPDIRRSEQRADPSFVASEKRNFFLLHAGRDFDQVDKKFLGSGEPGNIRPLGRGFYGYLVRNQDLKNIDYIVDRTKDYLKYAPAGNRVVHAFKLSLEPGEVWFAGKVWNEDLLTDEQKRVRVDYQAADKLVGPERVTAYNALNKKYPPGPPQRKEDRPIVTEVLTGDALFETPDLVEAAINDTGRLERIGKWDGQTTSGQIGDALYRAAADMGIDRNEVLASEKRTPLGFYSALADGVGQIKTNAAPAQGWRDAIKGLVNKGTVKADEVEWSGVNDWLDLQQGKVTKDQVADYLQQGGVKVEETVLGNGKGFTQQMQERLDELDANDDRTDAEDAEFQRLISAENAASNERGDTNQTKYGEYQLPGGENYREVLLTLPKKEKISWLNFLAQRGMSLGQYGQRPLSERRIITEVYMNRNSPENYQSKHWKESNVLAHIRVNDRVDADGNRVLFVEELQSDWGQAGKKEGFAGSNIKPVSRKDFDAYVDKLLDDYIAQQVQTGEDRQESERRGINMPFPQMAQELGRADEYTRMRAGRDMDMNGETSIPAAPFVAAKKFTVFKDGNEVTRTDQNGKEVKQRYDSLEASEAAAKKVGGEARDLGLQANTEGWLNLALKRVMVMAAEGGYDKVAFVNGEQSADRYRLANQVEQIRYLKNSDGTFDVWASDENGASLNDTVDKKNLKPGQVEDFVGKEVAQKIINGEGYEEDGDQVLTGLDLKVGGAGMKTFYDTIVPLAVKKLLPKVGGGQIEGVVFTSALAYQVQDDDGNLLQAFASREEAEWFMRDGNGEVLAYNPIHESKGISGGPETQPGFDITPEMRAKVEGGLPLFSVKRIVGDSGRAYTNDQRAAFQNIGRTVEVLSLKERVQALRKDLGKRMLQGIADQFAPIKDLTKDGYLLARLSKGSAGAIEAFLHHGKLTLQAGVYDADRSGGVIARVFAPLQGEAEDFLSWVAGNRAERLAGIGKENLFSPGDIAAYKSLDQGTTKFDYTIQHGANAGKSTKDRSLIYADTLKTFDEFNKNAIDMAEQSGLIDAATRPYWEHEFYVPFYRASADAGGFVGANIGKGLVRQNAFKALKGGQDKLNSDLLANTLQNWAHLIDASAKNRAAKATLEAAANLGVATEAPQSTIQSMGKAGGKAVWFMDGGVQRHFIVEDPYLLAAINGLEFSGLKGPLMDAMSSMKRWLTIGVTASPVFKIRNLIRDSIQSVASAPLSYNIAKNLADGYKASSKDSQTYVSALAGGGLIRFGTMLEGNAAARLRQLVKMGVDDSTVLDSEGKIAFVRNKFEKAFMAYSEIGNRGEEINRSALYKQLTDSGVSHGEAALMARDLMDFSMQGSWTSVRFLTQVVPFMNARIQGMVKLGKAAKEDPARFGLVFAACATTSLALMAAYHDDDDWKKREDWDRDNYWWFKLGGIAYRIPKPFEIGAMATLAERGVELFTDKEMTKERFLKRVLAITGDSLAMNPTPQMVKPVLDVYANKDSFSGRPIETMGMERLAPDYRFTAGTSMTARGLGTVGQAVTSTIGLNSLSPVQIDHLIKGYFSWIGATALASADMVLRPATGQTERPTADMFKLATQGLMSEVPSQQSRYVSQLYEQAVVLEQAHATYRQLIKDGKIGDARQYLTDNRDKLQRYGMVEGIKRGEAKFTEMIRMIERSAKSADAKREQIDKIRDQQDRMARLVAPGMR